MILELQNMIKDLTKKMLKIILVIENIMKLKFLLNAIDSLLLMIGKCLLQT
jgi:hypothetical protein